MRSKANCALRLLVLARNSDWFIALFAPVVIVEVILLFQQTLENRCIKVLFLCECVRFPT